MNETQQLETLWQVLESRDRVVIKAQQEYDRLQGQIKEQREDIQRQTRHLENTMRLHFEEVQKLTVQLQLSQAKKESLQQVIEQRNVTIEDIKGQLHRSEENRLFLLDKIDQLQEKLNESQATIEGMESSKFWQLRQGLVKFKKFLGFKG
ncbi:hypothetical protein [Crocosphaera sp. XPORK-15E]|uniref:hypothetical protein n=1 Tax=Crocosphaera sp. XPORK-15E TaxID=3110247 RepID=UPI002B1F00DE|nr:hypothetical protein [Crocosphaera sp. XPORK-15E]MEA5533080.1 hypothetical protein [Crocosphaera sp. XPORK-15E]